MKKAPIKALFNCTHFALFLSKKEVSTVGVQMTDNSAAVKALLERNKKSALEAMGLKAVQLIVNNMEGGYGKPIRKTGDLERDVQHKVGASGADTVDVGNSLNYSRFVHEGTRKMAGRPYIVDAVQKGEKELQETAAQYLKKGFE